MEKEENKRKIIKSLLKSYSLSIWIIVNILYIFIASFLATIKIIEYKHMANGYILFLILNVIIGIILVIKKRYKKNIIHLFLLLIIIFGIISTVFAVNPQVAIWGMGGRYEGMLTISYYISLMYLSSLINDKCKKIIAISIIATGLIQLVYAILQIYDVNGVYKMIHYWKDIQFSSAGVKFPSEIWATGFTTNPNFFSTYMLLCTTYALGLFIDEKGLIKSIVYLFISGMFMFGILIGNTMSCVVGLVAVFIYVVLYCIINKNFKKPLIIFLITLCVLFVGIKSHKTRIVKESNIMKEQTTEIAKGNSKDDYGSDRIFIWKNTLKIVPKNIIHGVGIDNYYYAFDGKTLISPDGKYYYDKAHNEYLQILVTEGIFCLISYIAMYAIIGIRGVKNSFNNKEIFLLLPIIGYLVQAFFNISVIEVAPIFYISLGLCMNKNKV